MTPSKATPVQPELDIRTGAFHADHPRRGPWPVSTTVVLGVASLTGTRPTSMPPLNDTIDPDVLNRHVRQRRNRDVAVSFEFQGYRVAVWDDGHVMFTPLNHEPVGGEDARVRSP